MYALMAWSEANSVDFISQPPRKGSFDDLVGASDQRQRDVDAERLGSLEVDDQLDFRDLLHWQLSRLIALENTTSQDASLAPGVAKVSSVGHQAASRCKLTILENRCNQVAQRKGGELFVPAVEKWIGAYHQRASSKSSKNPVEVLFGAGVQGTKLHP